MNKPEPKRITRLRATNVGGLKVVDVKVGKDTLLTGAKGVGKSSMLEMIRAVLVGKGLRADLVTIGEDNAVLLVDFADGMSIERTLNAPSKTATLSVEKDGMKVMKPQTFIDALLGPYACNPVDFCNQSAKEQGAMILALADMDDVIGLDDYTALSGGELLDGVDYQQHPLLVLADIEKALFEQRTVINRDTKQKRGACDELREDIPEGFDAEAVADATLGDLVDKQTAARQHNKDVEGDRRRLELVRSEIDNLREQLKSAEEQQGTLNEWLEENAWIDTIVLDQQIHDFQEQQDLLRIHDSANTIQVELALLSNRSECITELLDAVRVKPAELLAGLDELPIEGMGIDAEYGVTINGVPLGDLSDGERIDLAIEIALRYAGELPILLLNGLEALDPESQAQLREKLIASDCQCFVTKVTAGELVIEEW